jgi:isopropylmalate/homocitrate/citramalate synthase
VLVPNLQGYERARAVGAQEIAVFTAASEAFNRKNINASIDESIERFMPVIERAKSDGVAVRGYVSTVLGCPYQGEVSPDEVERVVDSAVSGTGGCPYAKGATGNVATEDVTYMLEGMGMHTGVDLDLLIATGAWLSAQLHKETASRVTRARTGA